MIRFSRNNNKTVVHIDPDLIPNEEFQREIIADYNYQAVLLTKHLNKLLCKKLENIRREAYNNGWSDAKAKRKKQESFFGWW